MGGNRKAPESTAQWFQLPAQAALGPAGGVSGRLTAPSPAEGEGASQ